MIDEKKDLFRNIFIAKLSDLVEYKDETKKEILWKNEDKYCEYKGEKEKLTIEFLDGLENVVVREYYKDGQLKIIKKYKDGLRNGESFMYDNVGKLWWKKIYKNGKELKWTIYNTSGKILLNF